MRFILLLFLSVACASANTNAVVVFAGHSIVFGTGASANSNFVSQLQSNLVSQYGAYLTNAGVSGAKIRDNYDQNTFRADLAAKNNYLKRTIYCLYGDNDLSDNTGLATVTNDFRIWVTNTRSNFPDAMVIGMTGQVIDWGVNATISNRWMGLQDFIRNTNQSLFDAVVDVQGNPIFQNPFDTTYYNGDKIHLSDRGYRELALMVMTNLLENRRLTIDWQVRKDGSDSNKGTTNSASGAFLTIAKAATMVSQGDSVTVNSGYYPENVDLKIAGTSTDPITWRASGGVTNQSFYITNSWQVIEGFRLNGSNVARYASLETPGLNTYGTNAAHNVTIRSNIFDCDVIGIRGVASWGSNWTFEANQYVNNWSIQFEYGGNRARLSGEKFSNTNGADSIRMYGRNVTFTNCTWTNWSAPYLSATNRPQLKIGIGYYFVSTNGTPSDFSNVGAGSWPYTLGEGNGFTATGTTPTSWGGTILDSGNHPDIIQADASWGWPPISNIVMEACIITDCGVPTNIWSATQLGNITDQGNTNHVIDWTFRNNLVVRVSNTMNLYAPSFRFYQNTFYRCAVNSGQVISLAATVAGTGSNAVFLNNLFVECGNPTSANHGWYYSSDTATTNGLLADYNLVVGTGAGTTKTTGASGWGRIGTETHGINGSDPLFVDAANFDFRLATGSPALNAGTNVLTIAATDINGASRDSTPSLGAFEIDGGEQEPGGGGPAAPARGQALKFKIRKR